MFLFADRCLLSPVVAITGGYPLKPHRTPLIYELIYELRLKDTSFFLALDL